MHIEITDERSDDGAIGQYDLLVDGEDAGELTWSMRSGRRVISHTGVRHQLRGHGLAAELMKRAMDDARAEGVQVLPVCSYAVAFLRGTDAYDDVVAG